MFESQADPSVNYIHSDRYLYMSAPDFLAFNTGLNATGDQSGLFVDNDQGFTVGLYTTVSSPVDLRGSIEIIKNNLSPHSTNYFGRDSLPVAIASNSCTFETGVINSAAVAVFGAKIKTNESLYLNRIAFNKGSDFETRIEYTPTTLVDKVQTLQDKTGIVALTSDISQSQGFTIQGIITNPTLNANVDNWNPSGYSQTTDIIRVDINANNREIRGLISPNPGINRIVGITNINLTGNDIRFINNAATSLAPNRFLLRDNTQKSIKPNETALFWYDHTSQRWRPYNRIG
jgi:hypothetical protein